LRIIMLLSFPFFSPALVHGEHHAMPHA